MSDRRMVFPYTLTAKIVNFPFKFYFNQSPHYRFYIYAVFCSLPVFYKLGKITSSEANYAKYAEFLRKEELELEKHNEHLL